MSLDLKVTELRNVPVGGCFIIINMLAHSPGPPVICMRVADEGGSASSRSVPTRFGLDDGHISTTPVDTLVVPLCGTSRDR